MNIINNEKNRDWLKLNIPEEVENKIRFLCNKFPTKEWSGVLFYNYEGSYSKKNLSINCLDILLMDIGTSTYTEFVNSPDLGAYIVEHPELMGDNIGFGLIHSHNSMATFFSGTDISTLKEEGKDRNHFVSLIVNNAGTYTAAITRKIEITKTVKSISFPTFNDVIQKTTPKKEQEVKDSYIEYSLMTINKAGLPDNVELEERIKAIEDKKKEVTTTKTYNYPTLFEENSLSLYDDYMPGTLYNPNNFVKENTPNTLTVEHLTVKLLSCEITAEALPYSNLKNLIDTMDSYYEETFPKMQDFENWMDMYLNYLILDYAETLFGLSSNQVVPRMKNLLTPYKSNKYVNVILKLLKQIM
jgi:hypothetical protein